MAFAADEHDGGFPTKGRISRCNSMTDIWDMRTSNTKTAGKNQKIASKTTLLTQNP
jgi:hypothetical protein